MDLDWWLMCQPEPLIQPYLLSHISSFVDNSFHHSRYFNMSGSMAIQDAFNCMSKFAGALLMCFARSNINRDFHFPGKTLGPNTRSCKSCTQVNHIVSARHNISILGRTCRITGKSFIPVFYKFTNFSLRKMCEQPEQLQSIYMLSLAAAFVPSLDKVSINSENVFSVQMEKENPLRQSCTNQSPCEVEHQGCDDLCFTGKLNGSGHRIEPSTGIEFPTVLDNNLSQETNPSGLSEVNI